MIRPPYRADIVIIDDPVSESTIDPEVRDRALKRFREDAAAAGRRVADLPHHNEDLMELLSRPGPSA